MRRFFLFFFLLLLAACAEKTEAPVWTPVSFAALPHWREASLQSVLPALSRSCAKIGSLAPDASFAGGKAGDWQKICVSLPPQDDKDLRAFFENYFDAYELAGASPQEGLFTGYYEPQLDGSRTKSGPYQTPLWQKPEDFITGDLGLFDPALSGKHLTGKIAQNRFVPYDTRAEIEAGSLEGRAKPLLYVRDPVAAFFLAIQGSGIVTLADGEKLRVAYAGQNGRPYVAIGKVLAERFEIDRPVTMPKIKAWLAAHPDRAQSLMNENSSYVFFRLNESDGAKGAMGLPLTPEASLAVDPAYVPLGSLLWLDPREDLSPRLVVAQDTGGAIKGPIRGDLFLGAGQRAEDLAGRLQTQGLYYLLWPKGSAPHG
jgi:membrane-bound lytic murein transglycosylase A